VTRIDGHVRTERPTYVTYAHVISQVWYIIMNWFFPEFLQKSLALITRSQFIPQKL